MAESLFRGPLGALGATIGNVSTSSGSPVDSVDVYDGPSFFYQGAGFLDPRFFPANKDGMGAGRLSIFYGSAAVYLTDAYPSASSATPVDICANQATTNGTPMTFVSIQASVANNGQCQHMPSCPLIPAGATAPITVFGLDMGFDYGTTTAASGTVTVRDSSIYTLGQWVVIGGAGASGLPLITQVTNPAASATTITVSPVATTAVTRAPISSGNAYVGFPANVTANAVAPYQLGGTGRFFSALEGVTRAVGINAAAGAAGGVFTVKGYDIYGNAMSEAITVGAGAAVAYGNKCFKYIASVTPSVTDASAHYGVGVSDTIGLNLRSKEFEYLLPFYNQVGLTAATGWTAPLAISSAPSTTTTADVRGSFQMSARGNNTGVGGAGATSTAISGTIRVLLGVNPPVQAMLLSTPGNYVQLFGVAQA